MARFRKTRNIVGIAIGLALTGAARMPVEQKMTEDLRERQIAAPKLSVETWNRMGQTGLAGTFGGLRSVMASMLSLRAQEKFSNQEWPKLRQEYEVITAMDPYNPFYWSHGGWHLAYNAASWARNNRDFNQRQRDTTEREYLELGDAFYRKGIKHLPDNDKLWAEIGQLWTNRYKRPDYARAAEAYKMAASFGRNGIYQRRYVYTLAQVPGREIEAYEEAKKLFAANPRHLRLSSYRAIFYALSTNPLLPASEPRPALLDIFPSLKIAYRDLYNYRFRTQSEGFYKGDIDTTIHELIEKLNVPDNWNPFKTDSRLRLPGSVLDDTPIKKVQKP